MTAPRCRLACLDMAGTTVGDDGAVLTAFAAALDAVGFADGTPERQKAVDYTVETMGQSKIEVFRAVTGDETSAHRANAAFEAAYLDAIRSGGVTAIDGAADAIAAMRAAGTKVALTTGFSADTRDALLDALGWHDIADLVLSPSDAGRGRPYPDLVLTAVLRLAVDDVHDVAVAGDTTSDLLTGHRAGAGVVAGVLTGAHTASDFATVPHTDVLASVADLPALLAS
ncbi:haloacid dehalogenase [Saccharomonospora sp. CUA-673]|uniref:phosphonatase-like hydrolase n=1 Tax=Saccharomonospora sp. CUA-673 TaxID=1904969 RepID=UPI0009657082|nr:phosphonatase-like hydrolase [Saccharomonospora sp. CUA-673]OLT45503.1 haloacid dehalogenase [Saccharomonospora sp. CUA-673]